MMKTLLQQYSCLTCAHTIGIERKAYEQTKKQTSHVKNGLEKKHAVGKYLGQQLALTQSFCPFALLKAT